MDSARAPELEFGLDQTQLSLLRLASHSQSLSLLQSAAIHDFKGSLNTLSLSVRLLEQTLTTAGATGKDAEVQRRCIKSLRDELIRLERQTGRVLEENRPDDLKDRAFTVLSVLEEAVVLLQPTAVYQQVAIHLERPARDVVVMGRAGWIRHAVLNLAGNALQAMPGGGSLRLELRREETLGVIVVSDTGPGITDEVREKMWEMSFSTRQGLGIGLPVVAHIIRGHGGTVVFEPQPVGASFAIRLPLAS